MGKPKEHAPAMSAGQANISTIPLKKNGPFSWGILKSKSMEDKWQTMPKGWTPASRDKYAASMAHEKKTKEGPVSSCIDKIGSNVSDPGAFCASLHDRVTGDTHWRGKNKQGKQCQCKQCQSKQSQADGGSSSVAALRKESASPLMVRTHFKESDGLDSAQTPESKFLVILIQEGLGNLKDCFYYTKDCLKNSVHVFEGIKCFADHPDKLEEEIQPERSTRDILGHFESVSYLEVNGRGQLQAQLVLLPGNSFDWARELFITSLEYASKYENKDFVGLSINAQGEASVQSMEDFVRANEIPSDVMPKISDALAQGITEIKPVAILKDAISCDLVTEAGAGGRILNMIERNKKPMKGLFGKLKEGKGPKEEMEKKEKKEADAPAGDGGQDDHADADQDQQLFQKMIKQYLGADAGGADQEEAMQMAKHAYEAHKEGGMEHEEAYEAAGQHLKMAAAIGKKMSAQQESKEEESEAHEDETPPPNPKADGKGQKMPPQTQESTRGQLLKANAELAKLRESVTRMEVRDYLEAKIKGCGKSSEFVSMFKESLGTPKTKTQIDECYKIFVKAYEAGAKETETSDFLFTEKSSVKESTGGKVLNFADCAS